MAKPRLHEIAKELGIESKKVVDAAKEMGMEVKSHQSSVTEEEADKLRARFGAKNTAKAETEPKPAPAESKEEKKPAEVNNTPSEKKPENKPAQGSGDSSQPRKKIIIVNNKNGKPQAQNTQSQPAKAYTGQPARPQQGAGGYNQSRPGQVNNRPGVQSGRPEVRRIIKPLTAPSDTPSVNMVQDPRTIQNPRKPKPEVNEQPKDKVQEQNASAAPANIEAKEVKAENVRPAQENNRPAGNDHKQNQNQNQGGRDNRSISMNDRPGQRSKGGYRGGNGYGANTSEKGQNTGNFRQNQAGRTNSFQGAQNPQRGGFNAGAPGRGFAGGAGNQRPNGRPGAGFGNGKGAGGGKIFTSDGPTSNKGGRDQRRRNEERNSKHKDINYNEEELSRSKKAGRFIKPEKKVEEVVEEQIKVITLPDTITIGDLAAKMKMKASDIIKKLFLTGKIVTVNQEISYEDAENIAMEYEILCEHEVKINVIEELLKEDEEDTSKMKERPPVVCVMGHVDHGKTSLLDAIRKTHVTAREAGGITQAIGAYTVDVKGKSITFLDTPGHEAFTAMRMRGANSTDIAILVVAADDGVMPQTVEAINHAKAAGVEIIVAVNKIDKPSANIDRVKQELSEYELISEDWGGSTVFAPVSAKTGEGLDNLLDMILLTADVLELKADPDRKARGVVIEAQLDKGRGPVATVLVQKGTLHIGDFVSAGAAHGKVRAMRGDKGENLKTAGPSTPVEILGLSSVPEAGEVFLAHASDKDAKSYADTYTAENKKQKLAETQGRMSLEDLFSKIKEENLKELDIIIKADVQGSVEALKESLLKLSNEEVVVKVIHSGVGAINESDVSLAGASNAIIIGFNVKPDSAAGDKAEQENVDVRCYDVIYKAIEDVERAMKGMLDPVFEEKILGHAEIRQIFKASAIGNIAGSYVLDGIMQRGAKVRITRGEDTVYEGVLSSLKRFKDDVKEVKEGFECGLVFDGFDAIKEEDRVEAYIMVEVPRT
ncbi:MAG: translation initiation factor IF-2 [Lachnospiraceae bacterium]|nr:translation initiation factor IF-2 [Lachnospiraceae bacterium]